MLTWIRTSQLRRRRARPGWPLTVVMAALILSFTATATGAPSQENDPKLEVGRELTRMLFDNEIDPLWARMSPEMQGALGSVEALGQFRTQIGQQLGDETEIVEETVSEEQGFNVYIRRARFASTGAMLIEIQWATAADGQVAGFYVRPAQEGGGGAAPSGGEGVPVRFDSYELQGRASADSVDLLDRAELREGEMPLGMEIIRFRKARDSF